MSRLLFRATPVAALAACGYYLQQASFSHAEEKTQQAFCFIKPHAVNDKVIALSKDMLAKSGIKVTSEGVLTAKTIDDQKLIDTHYGAIAKRAVVQKPHELTVPAKAQANFEKTFGLTWAQALAQEKVYNATDACALLGLDGAGLDAEWGKLKKDVNLIKFGGGFYCAKIGDIFVMNGFYMAMRAAYTAPGKSIHWFTLEWPESKLSWSDFRGKTLGATDPSSAAPGSVRRAVYDDWRALGLDGQPDTGDNGVHASASPFEALAERVNWLGANVEEDAFGKDMLAAGLSKATIAEWATDPVVNGGSLFDALEDLDTTECLAKAAALVK